MLYQCINSLIQEVSMGGRMVVAVVVLLGCGVLVAGLWRRKPAEVAELATADEYTAAVARHLRWTRWIAWPLALGLAAASIAAFHEQAVIVAPVLTMLGVVVAFTVGELTAPVPARIGNRSASLEPRVPVNYLTPAHRAFWIASMVVAVVVATTALLLAGETGRDISLSCAAGGQTIGPFPGLAYGAAGLWALVPVEVTGNLAFRRVTNRPASSVPAAAPADRLLRVATTYAVVRATAAASLLVIGGVGFSAGIALVQLGHGPCAAGWRVPLGWTFLVLAVLAALGLIIVAIDAIGAGRSGSLRALARQHQ
jgi:hypothetical protein